MFIRFILVIFVLAVAGNAYAQPQHRHAGTIMPSSQSQGMMLVAKPSYNDVISSKNAVRVIKRCIATNAFKGTNITNDQTVLITLKTGELVNLRLRDRCYGLAYDDKFYYQQNPGQQLCEQTDAIIARSGSRCIIDKIETVKGVKSKKLG